ncbi:MAG: hypothetical protein IKQ97_05405 [Eubacterium sp.]|nr:hypothetical protein [Eubacterium sp.]
MENKLIFKPRRDEYGLVVGDTRKKGLSSSDYKPVTIIVRNKRDKKINLFGYLDEGASMVLVSEYIYTNNEAALSEPIKKSEVYRGHKNYVNPNKKKKKKSTMQSGRIDYSYKRYGKSISHYYEWAEMNGFSSEYCTKCGKPSYMGRSYCFGCLKEQMELAS